MMRKTDLRVRDIKAEAGGHAGTDLEGTIVYSASDAPLDLIPGQQIPLDAVISSVVVKEVRRTIDGCVVIVRIANPRVK